MNKVSGLSQFSNHFHFSVFIEKIFKKWNIYSRNVYAMARFEPPPPVGTRVLSS